MLPKETVLQYVMYCQDFVPISIIIIIITVNGAVVYAQTWTQHAHQEILGFFPNAAAND